MDALAHGTPGLLLAYGLSLIGVLAVLVRRRSSVPTLLMSPLVALPALVVGAIAASILSGVFKSASAALTVPANAALLLAAGAGGGLWLNRKRQADDVHKRGAVVEHGTRPRGRAAKAGITLAGIDILPLDEPKHFKLMGTTGAGKSTAIREILTGALARGDRALIADPDGGYLARFYDAARGDVILNPFDERTARWNLFGEIEQPYDVEQVARSLITDGPDPSGREWRAYARTFLSAVLEYLKLEGPQDIEALWHLVAVADTEELRPLLAGTPAQPFLAEGAGKMFQSIRSTASPALAALKHLSGGTGPGFGVRRWVREGKGVLFLPYKAGQIAALRDLIASWLRLAIFETMNQPEGDVRLWFVIDELDALGQIDGLKDALARLRKFGGRCVLGFQSIAQVSGTYGDADAHTIVENCGNTLILRCSASERGGTAEFASRLIGQREVIRQQTSISTLARPTGFLRTTRTVGEHLVTEDAVMASEIEQLPDLQGYLKLASVPEWRRVKLLP
jgi:type IV secretory pathway TraG/TraD family ATPase VirD4